MKLHAWVRTNLFGSPANGLLTVLVLALLFQVLPPLVDWAVLRASWGGGDPERCRQAGGACWTLLTEKYRLMLFGIYP